MTMLVTVYVKEGIVMASDSRVSFDQTRSTTDTDGRTETIANLGIHYSDNAEKLFVTKNHVGISTCGGADVNNSPIAGYIEAFVREHADTPVDEIPEALLNYFWNLDPSLNTEFHIAGYAENDGAFEQHIYRITTNPHVRPENRIEVMDSDNQGAMWNGQTDVLSRLINPIYFKTEDTNGNEHYQNYDVYEILWHYFNLQDAVNFAEYAIKTTIDTIRFQSRSKNVGGPIDILVIKPDGAKWLSKKKLHIGSKPGIESQCDTN